MIKPKEGYEQVFQIEIDGWCHGLAGYMGKVTAPMVHRVIRELAISFEAAIKHFIVFDAIKVSEKISTAAQGVVSEKEVAFAILMLLPRPAVLDDEAQCVLALVIDQIERKYGGAIDRFENRFQTVKKRAA